MLTVAGLLEWITGINFALLAFFGYGAHISASAMTFIPQFYTIATYDEANYSPYKITSAFNLTFSNRTLIGVTGFLVAVLLMSTALST